MRILYGVQGTGNGHITRARALSKELANAGIEVDYIFSGRAPAEYFDMEPFGSYKTLRGLTFAARNGGLQFLKTATTNNLLSLRNEIQSLDVRTYDLVITDFEPVSAWAARLRHKYCVGIGHQYAFRYAIPMEGVNWAAKSVLKYFAPANIALGIHWDHFNRPILPPIVEPPLANAQPTARKILVYLPFENIQQICAWLEPEPEFDFYIYHGSCSEAHEDMNLHLRPLSRNKFQEDLADCDGVISNSGFELASETNQYGKKLLTKPLNGQTEQLSNAAALKILKRADVIFTLESAALAAWLRKKNPLPVRYPNVAREIVQWIVDGRQEPLETLSRRLWRACEPAGVCTDNKRID
jgi:uncharacterized protein (TIGR00661 family)